MESGQPRGWRQGAAGRAGVRDAGHRDHHPVRLRLGRDDGRGAEPVRPRQAGVRGQRRLAADHARAGASASRLAVWVAGGVSGAHLNPAVTLAHALRRGFPWSKVPAYWGAQVLRRVRRRRAHLPQLPRRDLDASSTPRRSPAGTPDSVATTRSSPPSPRRTSRRRWGRSIDQIIGTGCWSLVIFAVIDEFNAPVKANLAPLVVGLIVVGDRRLVRRQRRAMRSTPPATSGRGMLAWIAGWKTIAMPGDYGNDRHLHVGPDRRAR